MRLLSMGPTSDGRFGINLTGGPLHAFTAYLIELMTGPDGEMWNCMETKVQAADLKGTFILTVQRADGKTPMDLRMEAEARATTAREKALTEAADAITRRYNRDCLTELEGWGIGMEEARGIILSMIREADHA